MAKQTWVYLMRDLRSGFIKIGESQNPVYREKTLQAEQPLIELIEAWQTTSDSEKELHKMYAEKRLRGEWFALDENEIAFITLYFYECKRYSTGTSEYEESDLYKMRKAAKEAEIRSFDDAAKADWIDFAFEGFGYEF